MHIYLRVYGVALKFETNSKQVHAMFLKEFGSYASDRVDKIEANISVLEGDKFDFKVPEYAVRDSIVFPSAAMYVRKGKIFLLEEGKYFIVVDQTKYEVDAHTKPSSPIFEKVRFITKRALIRLLENKGFVSIHGSAVSDDGGALLFTGVSGSGKTTSLLTLLERGYRMVSDDVILMNEEVLPFHLTSMIHKDTLKRFPSLASGLAKNSRWVAEANGWWMNLSSLYPVQQGPTIPRTIFHTHVWNSVKSSCREIDPSKMLSNLMKNYMMEANVIFKPTSEQLKRVFLAYSKIVEEKPCYNLYVGRNPKRLFRTIKKTGK